MARKGAGRNRWMLNMKKKTTHAKKISMSMAQALELQNKKKYAPSVISYRNRSSAGVTQHPTGAKL